MSKYKFYRNKKTKHPSIEIDFDKDNKIWKNLEVTHKPSSNQRYIELDVNPNPFDTDKSYVRRYVRKDSLGIRGYQYKNFSLSDSDKIKIDNYLNNKKIGSKRSDIHPVAKYVSKKKPHANHNHIKSKKRKNVK